MGYVYIHLYTVLRRKGVLKMKQLIVTVALILLGVVIFSFVQGSFSNRARGMSSGAAGVVESHVQFDDGWLD